MSPPGVSISTCWRRRLSARVLGVDITSDAPMNDIHSHSHAQPLREEHTAETGAIREGPWLNLRTAAYGMVYFVNLITHEVRWFPPRLWMEGWISRPNYAPSGDLRDVIFEGHRLNQYLLPIALARQRVECGAPPFLYERGLPQYPPDENDTPHTHPACTTYPDHGNA